MDDSRDEEIQEFMKEIADDLGYTSEERENVSPEDSAGFRLSRKAFILGGVAIVVLSVLISLFLGAGGVTKRDLGPIRTRVQLLEEKLARLEATESRITYLENREIELQQYITDVDRSRRSLSEQLEKTTAALDRLENAVGAVSGKRKPRRAAVARPVPPAEGRYHEVRPGETLYRIAQRYNISIEELCRLNNITPEEAIYPGQKLLVGPKSQQ
jgi:LysM repeat protein